MSQKDLQLSYECLNAIGNTLDLESMVSEILITFSKQTHALSAAFYKSMYETQPMIAIGQHHTPFFSIYDIKDKEFCIFKEQKFHYIVLVIQSCYLLFSYSKQTKNIDNIAKIFNSFRNKIIIAISACKGVQQLEELNEELEHKIEKGVEKIRAHEKALLLKSKQAAMGQMLEMIAHQWRQPISSIGMISNNLLFDITLEQCNAENIEYELNNINTQVEYLSHTINDFTNFFKQGKEKQLFQLDIMIEKTLSLIKKQLDSRKIEVHISHNCPITLFAYRNELMQVILNILNNSKEVLEGLKAQNKKITITTTVTEGVAILKISDTGGGIDQETMPHIFEPYFSTKTKKEGTGLGLYMSKIIIQEHLQGEISVNNTTYGCEFTIKLPLE